MHDLIINERLGYILESIDLIEERFKKIKSAAIFNSSKEGLETMDSIAMRLQHIAENIKKINHLQPEFFENQILLDPNPIIGFRDFISHHYEKTDADIIFDICVSDISVLKEKISSFLKK